MSRSRNLINNFEETAITILLPLMVVTIFVGTFGRYTGLFLLPWAEELARYLMIWVVFLGIGAGAKRNAHFVVDVMQIILPKGLRKYHRALTTACVVFFMGVLVYYSLQLIMRVKNMGQISPSLGIPMWLIYLAIPIGCILMALRSIQYCHSEFRPPVDPQGTATPEQAEETAEIYE